MRRREPPRTIRRRGDQRRDRAALGTGVGGGVRLRLPGRAAPLALPVTAIADLSRAKPLFYSRKASDLEAFLYLAHTIVVDSATFQHTVIPAFQAATATVGQTRKSQPLVELDVLLSRSRLQADPGTALAQTRRVARTINQISPGQNYLIDNASNTLEVARDDAAVAKRMFLFLGLPGALLAAFLAAYAGSILAAAQRREQALLRSGAHTRVTCCECSCTGRSRWPAPARSWGGAGAGLGDGDPRTRDAF